MGTRKQRSLADVHREDVALYVAAGGDETVQRVMSAVHSLSRKLNQWYDSQFADLDLTSGEWTVLAELASNGKDDGLTPSVLADAANVAPSSMTHRLDRMCARGLVERTTDPHNRVRVRVHLTADGWALFRAAIRESNMLESDVLEALDKRQRAQLITLLERVIDTVDSLDS